MKAAAAPAFRVGNGTAGEGWRSCLAGLIRDRRLWDDAGKREAFLPTRSATPILGPI